jgi:hypothetical protein
MDFFARGKIMTVRDLTILGCASQQPTKNEEPWWVFSSLEWGGAFV